MIKYYVCSNIYEYVELIHNYTDHYPVLGLKAGDLLRGYLKKKKLDYSAADFFGEITYNYPINCNVHEGETERLVISLNNDDWYWPAYFHAKLTDSEIFYADKTTAIEEIIRIKKPKFVTLCGSPDNLDTNTISRLHSIQLEKWSTPAEFYYGVLSARDISIFSFVIVKNDIIKKEPAPLPHIILIDRIDFDNENKILKDDLTILPRKAATVKIFEEELAKHDSCVLSMIGHGRDYLIWMSDSIICAKSKDAVISPGRHMPSCMYINECFKDQNRTQLCELNLKHIFLNSCSSLKVDDSIFGREFSLVYTALEGNVVSYLGTPDMIDGKKFSNYLYVAMLKSGYSLGETSGLINRSYADLGLGPELTYYLVGDPTIQVFHEPDCFIVNDSVAINSTLSIDIPNCFLVIINLGEENIIDSFMKGIIRIIVTDSVKQDLYGVLRYFQGRTQLFIFTNGRMKATKLNIDLQKKSMFNYKPIEYLEFFQLMKVTGDTILKNKILAIKELGMNISRDKKDFFFLWSQLGRFYQRYSNLEKKIESVGEDIIYLLNEKTHKKRFSFAEHCIESGLYYESDCNSGECHYCNQPLKLYVYRHPVFSNIVRNFYRCPICGDVFDFFGDTELSIYFRGKSQFEVRETIKQEVVIHNRSEYNECKGFGGVRVVEGEDLQVSYNYPDFKICVPPKTEMSYNVEISFPLETKPHDYWLKANIIVDGNLWNVKRHIFLATISK